MSATALIYWSLAASIGAAGVARSHGWPIPVQAFVAVVAGAVAAIGLGAFA